MRTESVTAKYEKCDDQLQSEIRHGCQMAIVRVLDGMHLALQACRTMAVLHYAVKFVLILSLDCTELEERNGSNFDIWQH